jgi:molybdate transport system ATP-binding protein
MTETVDIALSGKVGSCDLDVAFQMPVSGITALSGPSGAGKTTILKAVAGFTRLAGVVRLGPKTLQDATCFVPPHQRRIAMVFQEPSLFAHLNVSENLKFGQRHLAEPRGSVELIAQQFGILPLLKRKPASLSGGEAQRVAMAQAVLSEPRLILMDEPLSSLDAAAKQSLLPLIRSISAQSGVGVLYVSHDPLEIAQLTKSVIYLERGRILMAPERQNTLEGLDDATIKGLALMALNAGLG